MHKAWLGHEVAVSVELTSSDQFPFQIFYTDNLQAPFSPSCSRTVFVPRGRSRLNVSLPVENLKKIRLDFGDGSATIHAKPIRLSGFEDRILDWKNFRSRHDIGSFETGADGSVAIAASGGDPYCAYGPPLDVVAKHHLVFSNACFIVVAGFLLWYLFWWRDSKEMPTADTMESRPIARDLSFDLAKFLLIVWVVAGHIGSFRVVGTSPYPLPELDLARVALNMPAFFLIGGYMADFSFRRHALRDAFLRFARLLWPTIPFSILFSCVSFLSGNSPWLSFVRFPRWLWFLRSFAIVYLWSAVLFRLGKNDKARATLFFAFWAAFTALDIWLPREYRFWLPWTEWEPSMTVRCLFSFGFGLFALHKWPLHRSPRISALCGIVCFLGIAAGCTDSDVWSGLYPYSIPDPSTADGLQILSTAILAPVTAVSGSIFLLGLCRVSVARFPRISAWLASFGSLTLGIYLLHEWPILLSAWTGHALLLPSWTWWIATISWTFACAFAARWIVRRPILKLILFGMGTGKANPPKESVVRVR